MFEFELIFFLPKTNKYTMLLIVPISIFFLIIFAVWCFGYLPLVWFCLVGNPKIESPLNKVNFDGRYSRKINGMYPLIHDNQLVLVIADRKIAAEFYKTQKLHPRDRSFSCLGEVCSSFIGDAIGTKYAKEWTRHRKSLKCMMQTNFIKQYHEMMITETLAWLDREIKNPFSVNVSAQRFALVIISKMVYGELDYTQLFALADMHSELMNILVKKKLCESEQNKLQYFNEAWIRFNELQPVQPDTLRDYIIKHGDLSEKEVLDNLNEILLFNLDVMQSSIGALFYCLTKEKVYVKELYDEVHDRDLHALLKCDDFMKKVDQFILETARLYPSLSLTFPETLGAKQELGGIVFPKGTIVLLDTLSINYTDGFKFNPTRHKPTSNTKEFHRFGLGARSCLGQHFAHFILQVLLIETVRRYTLTFVSRDYVDKKYKGSAFFTPYLNFPPIYVCKRLCIAADEAILCGLSIGNSYYKRDTVMHTITCCANQGRVYPFIPNSAYSHTLRAQGKSESKIQKKLRNDTGRFRRWITEADVNTEFFVWDDFTDHNEFLSGKEEMLTLYETDLTFKADVDTLTKDAIAGGDINEGKLFLIEELAFLTRACELLHEEKLVYVYHQEWPIFTNLISGVYNHPPVSNIRFCVLN